MIPQLFYTINISYVLIIIKFYVKILDKLEEKVKDLDN